MILKYLDKLQENIEDKLLPKLNRNFSNQEKTLIDNFIFSILKKDKDSKISYTNTKIYDDRSGVSEEITKSINLWEEDVRFTFHKIYFSKKFEKLKLKEKITNVDYGKIVTYAIGIAAAYYIGKTLGKVLSQGIQGPAGPKGDTPVIVRSYRYTLNPMAFGC